MSEGSHTYTRRRAAIAALVSGMTVLAVNACGDGNAAQCPALAGNAGADVQLDVAPGQYEVAVDIGGIETRVGWSWRTEVEPLLPREVRTALPDGRWVRVSTVNGGINVTECWSGATAEGGCAELGPPRGGAMVIYRGGAEVVRLALYAPVEETVSERGCPVLHSGRIR